MATAKPQCKYGSKCFRTNAAHLAQFSHPTNAASDVPDQGNGIVLEGKKVMFVGLFPDSSRGKIVGHAKEYGCLVASSLTTEVDLVVAADGAGTKVQEAQDLGVQVMSQNEWEALLTKSTPSNKTKKLKKDTPQASDSDEEFSPTAKKSKAPTGKAKASAHEMSDSEGSQPMEAELLFKNFQDESESKMDASSTAVKRAANGGDGDSGESPAKKSRAEGNISPLRPPTPGPYSPHGSSHSPTPDRSLSRSPSPSPPPSPAASPGPGSRSPSPSPAGRTSRSPSPSPGRKGKRAKCKYWDNCYRKDPNHLSSYLHPGDESEEDDPGEGSSGISTRAAYKATVKPKHEIIDGQEVEVLGGGGSYRLKRTGDTYYCTCYDWKNQSKPASKRTCKHLQDHLGEKFEKVRTGDDTSKEKKSSLFPYSRAQRHKKVSVLLAHKWTESVDPTGWWMSEKLDGVRAYWDGSTFFSRLGNEFIPPKWFIANMPSDIALDGELFGGRGKFQMTVKIVKNPGCDDWKKLKYSVFDSPSMKGQPFEKRISAVKAHFEKHKAQYVDVLEQYKCKGPAHLQEELTRIVGLGGEGVMIRKPQSMYEGGRSHTLLKLKTFHDAEAVIIGYEEGKGSNTGLVGALRCRMECGIEFSVGSGLKNAERRKPPKIGSIITYRFQEYTNSGKPRFPTYVGVRIDADGPKDVILPDKPSDD